MSFRNKVVLVTGGSSGIGAITAIAFAKEGARLAIVGRHEARLSHIADEIRKNGPEPLIIKADVSSDQDLKTIVEKTIERFEKLDVLVNNAGILLVASVLDENFPKVYDEVINTNLRSAVLLTSFAAPHLIKTKGNIVNVSSVAGTTALAGISTNGYSSYCTSKAGLDHFSRLAALELAEKGVRVNIVSPGLVETPIIQNTGVSNWDVIVYTTALKILIQPEEVADLILYLASDKARSISGANFTIDSGLKLKM